MICLHQARDLRVDSWPLMNSAWPTALLCLFYALVATRLGPALMRGRPPMQLSSLTLAYNAAQVLSAAYLVHECMAAGWATHYKWGEAFVYLVY